MRGLSRFAEGVVVQLCALLGILPEGLVCAQVGGETDDEVRIVAAAGQYSGLIDRPLSQVKIPNVRHRLERCLLEERNLYDDGTCLYFGMGEGRAMAALVDVGRELDELDQQLLRAFCSNIAVGFENVLLYSQLLDQAYNDPLLRLPNRNRFVELLDKNLKDPSGVTLALIDIDDFSDINDAFGHHFGDQVLQAVVHRMARCWGATSPWPASAPTPSACSASTPRSARRPCRRSLPSPSSWPASGCSSRPPPASCGWANPRPSAPSCCSTPRSRSSAPSSNSAAHLSISLPPWAATRASASSCSRACAPASRRASCSSSTSPRSSWRAGRVIGAEALLRWRTTDGRFIPPDQFIPLAEQSGLIIPIGEFVVRTACQQLCQDAPPGPRRLPHGGQHLDGAVPPPGLSGHAGRAH